MKKLFTLGVPVDIDLGMIVIENFQALIDDERNFA
jgi:hypothetical protein